MQKLHRRTGFASHELLVVLCGLCLILYVPLLVIKLVRHEAWGAEDWLSLGGAGVFALFLVFFFWTCRKGNAQKEE